jgi:scyllo-inositol 2-dehydrogenase (NADP+)
MQAQRLGIIGPGLIWQARHWPVLKEMGKTFAVAAFCAASERRREEVAREHPGAPFLTDYRALLRREDLDGVLVLTPIALNAPVALAALQAGKDVFLEKPMARSLAEGQALLQAAASSGRRLWVLEQEAYAPRWRAVRDVVASGELGELVLYDRMMHYPESPATDRIGYSRTAWRIEADFPLGTFFDGGHHLVASLSTIFGAPQWVFASGAKLRPGYGAYDHLLMQFGYRGQLRATLSHSSFLGDGRNYFHIRGTRGLLAVEWERLVILPHGGEPRSVPLPAANSYEAMWRALARCLAEGSEPDYSPARAYDDLRTLLAVARSAASGERATLPTAEEVGT